MANVPVSANQSQFLTGLQQVTKYNPTVLAAWLRNEEPMANQNTDPAGHGRFNFLNVGITDTAPHGAASAYWNTTPQAAGVATGKWLLGQLAIPGFGKSAASIQALGRYSGASPQAQIAAIQHSGWASGGETALPGLFQQFSGQKLPTAPAVSAPAPGVAPAAPSVAPPTPTAAPNLGFLQSGLDLGAQTQQRAFDALRAIGAPAHTAAPALDLSSLMAAQGPAAALTPPHSGISVPVHPGAKTPKGLDPQAAKAIALAKQYIGVPYLYGGASPKGFDCSGLLQYTWSKNGVKIPRTAAEQAAAGTPVSLNALRPGDGLYFKTEGNAAGITHAAMFIGNGQILEAPHTGQNVKIAPLAGYYQQHLVVARRFG